MGQPDLTKKDLEVSWGRHHRLATDAGIVMSECRILPENGRRHFMTRRFDRTGSGGKLHMQSLCALKPSTTVCGRPYPTGPTTPIGPASARQCGTASIRHSGRNPFDGSARPFLALSAVPVEKTPLSATKLC